MKTISWPRFKDELIAFTSTRNDGFSNAPYNSLNLAFHVGDDKNNVSKNREKLFKEVGFTKDSTVIVKQSHSDINLEATFIDGGRGYDDFDSGLPADALFTTKKGLALGIYHADCVPVFIYVPHLKIAGIIHAGESGSLASISAKMITDIKAKYKVSGEQIFAFIGPSLKFGHRRISKNWALQILAKHPELNYAIKAVDPEYFLDLPFLNFMNLIEQGIPSKNIDIYEDCTYENADDFFSYVRDKTTGRLMSFIKIL